MKNSIKSLPLIGLLLVFPVLVTGCGAVREKEKVKAPETYLQAKVATEAELMDLININYAGIDSIAVPRFNVELTGGSLEDGYFEKYRKANGYLVAKRPDSIFVNILNPLTKSSVLTMASTGNVFQIWIPSKNQYVTGPAEIAREVDNPVYNARPSHFLQGIMIEAVELDQTGINYYFEEEDDGIFRYYVLVVLARSPGSSRLTLHRKIWIERSSLQVRKQQYFQDSRVVSDIEYGPSVPVADRMVPTTVRINRPLDKYSIDFEIETDSVSLNRELKASVFVVPKPPGAELIRVEEENSE